MGFLGRGSQVLRAERELVEGGCGTGIKENSCGVQGRGEPGSSYRKASGDLTLMHLPPVVSWIDVYARATCQPREVVVPLTVELMGTVAKQLVPSCVTVQRCGGCCPDDGLECVPTGQHQVRMQVLGRVGCALLGRMLVLQGEGWRWEEWPEPWLVGELFSLQPTEHSLPLCLSWSLSHCFSSISGVQILMIRYPSSQLGEMSLEEHSQCECRCRPGPTSALPETRRGGRWAWWDTTVEMCPRLDVG